MKQRTSKPTHVWSWNVNGIRSCMGKGLADWWQSAPIDILCLQETKIDPDSLEPIREQCPFPHQAWHCADRKGYSGTAILSKEKPIAVSLDIPRKRKHRGEGRVIAAEFADKYVVSIYVPNAKRDLSRLDYRTREWDPDLRRYLSRLASHKPLIVCGDFNVAHTEIDLANPRTNTRNAGFTDEERSGFTQLLAAGFTDIFRHHHPGEDGHYTWWTWRNNARDRNIGWRIDYILVSAALVPVVKRATIADAVRGSDHCPVQVQLGGGAEKQLG